MQGLEIVKHRKNMHIFRLKNLLGNFELSLKNFHSTWKVSAWENYIDGFFNIATEIDKGPVVRKPDNANPGLKLNQGFNFSC